MQTVVCMVFVQLSEGQRVGRCMNDRVTSGVHDTQELVMHLLLLLLFAGLCKNRMQRVGLVL